MTNESIAIKGSPHFWSYSAAYNLREIYRVEIIDTLPKINLRLNGFGAMGLQRGYFLMEGNEKALLLIDEKSSPFIYLEFYDGKKVFVNFKNPDDTFYWYNAIKEKSIWY